MQITARTPDGSFHRHSMWREMKEIIALLKHSDSFCEYLVDGAGVRHFAGFICTQALRDDIEISYLLVAPNHRRKGVGKRLVRHIETFLKSNEAFLSDEKLVQFITLKPGDEAVAFWKAMGYLDGKKRLTNAD
jgi:ribosomal protein S18 acetylase RimI-like enzyme